MMIKKRSDGKTFSHSKLSTFEQCKLKYKLRYIDGIIPEMEKTIESHLGSIVHKTLEWLYWQVKENKISKIEELAIVYSKIWKEDYESEILIVKKNLTAEDYFNKGIEFLINYYTEHHPFNDNTLDIEKEIFIDLGEYKIRGFIDRLSYNSKTKEYEIHDYKTSNNFPTDDDVEKDRQLALYAIAIKETYGKDKGVKLIWHYLSFKKRIYSTKTNEQLEKLKADILELIKKIESTAEFEPNKSKLCHWCEYKQICPVWGNKIPERQMNLDKF